MNSVELTSEEMGVLTLADVIKAYKDWDCYAQRVASLEAQLASVEEDLAAVQASEWPAHRRFTEIAEAYAIQIAMAR